MPHSPLLALGPLVSTYAYEPIITACAPICLRCTPKGTLKIHRKSVLGAPRSRGLHVAHNKLVYGSTDAGTRKVGEGRFQGSRYSDEDRVTHIHIDRTRAGYDKRKKPTRYKPEQWQIQKKALAEKFGESGWVPRKKLSPEALDGIRALHSQNREKNTTETLAQQFEVSPEAIRRILKSKWQPNEEERSERMQRWERRGERIWSTLAQAGFEPPKKWQAKGIRREKRSNRVELDPKPYLSSK